MRTETKKLEVNWLAPLNLTALFFGPWFALQVVAPTWINFSQYSLVALIALVTWILATLKWTRTWTRTKTTR